MLTSALTWLAVTDRDSGGGSSRARPGSVERQEGKEAAAG